MPVKNEKDSYLYGALAYFWVASVAIFVLKKEDSFIRFHAKQGMVLFVASFFTWMPIIGWLFGIAIFIATVSGFIKALQGERYRLPIVSEIAEKINL